jgi:hypothetical protein
MSLIRTPTSGCRHDHLAGGVIQRQHSELANVGVVFDQKNPAGEHGADP